MIKFLNYHFDEGAIRKIGKILSLSCIFIFPLVTFFRLFPFTETLQDILNASGHDDWGLYINTALDIKHNGLLIQSVNGDYDYPNGFFYSYFVAFCFTLFGEHPAPVYILQSAMLGCTIALVYSTFKNKMDPLNGLFFISTLIVFAFLDVHKYYSIRFLSENLVIFTIALFFYFVFKAIESKRTMTFVLSAFFLGLSILTRPNLFPVGIMIFLVLCFFAMRGKISLRHLLLFLVIVCAIISLLALRNKMVSGNCTFFPVNSFGFFETYFLHPNILFEDIYKRFMFCLGFLQILYPDYQWRPHWTLMWIVYVIYLILKLRQKEKMEAWEIISHMFIFTYFGLLVFVIDVKLLVVYGFRYIIPATFMVLPFVFMGLETIFQKYSKSKSSQINK